MPLERDNSSHQSHRSLRRICTSGRSGLELEIRPTPYATRLQSTQHRLWHIPTKPLFQRQTSVSCKQLMAQQMRIAQFAVSSSLECLWLEYAPKTVIKALAQPGSDENAVAAGGSPSRTPPICPTTLQWSSLNCKRQYMYVPCGGDTLINALHSREKILCYMPGIGNEDLRNLLKMPTHRLSLTDCAGFMASQFISESASTRQQLFRPISGFIRVIGGPLAEDKHTSWNKLPVSALLYAYPPPRKHVWTRKCSSASKIPESMGLEVFYRGEPNFIAQSTTQKKC
ncbi:hypothetical protein Z517_08699 [Fonsecaea pedrosoi CBS 271.37]|uniref:Uncharacterized protein n=1 Tax=Fonsecaea pedrosoi CBS 271.37 TaxID=1442368 RepID=A0A0D2GJX8_9EURO|nr:uncharacterized protein Z517_08699 [Fonsecaea pedrosoi CBS 271.37]KIW78860.1 hypothetical protein Z517_08699 [Fonsecaea pedrosoi CBS 271.37]